jgi:hypothetical protein
LQSGNSRAVTLDLQMVEAHRGAERAPTARPPAKEICILLPVWGADFIGEFLDNSLPTLLAPGNVPALAAAFPSRFVFLTRMQDEAVIRAHPACARLSEICAVEFAPIDDLIMQGNHSTTITLAYARAVYRAGEAMLDTCFFFLVSDYIMADGSLAAVLARMQAGASAVQVGNFQLDEATAESWLRRCPADAGTERVLRPRELMRRALGCLHPLTLANIVNLPLCYNTQANRLLWRVDDDTLIGRFYLLHMICIRPELTDFVIGASCDYSFVPEMCPSGNVVTITDSDEYLVVEVQPQWHESGFVSPGVPRIADLATSLSEWTTAGHRANAEQTIAFHAADLPPSLPAAIAEADRFIGQIATELARKPQPHRDHPYWRGAIAAFRLAVLRRDTGGLVRETRPGVRSTVTGAFSWLQKQLCGQTPEVSRFHPRWRDLRRPLAAWKALIAEPQPRLLIAANRETLLTNWLRRRVSDASFVSLLRLTRGRPATLKTGSFDACFVELIDYDFMRAGEFIGLVAPLLRPGAELLVVSLNSGWAYDSGYFGRMLGANITRFSPPSVWPEEVYIGSASYLRWSVNGICAAAAGRLMLLPRLIVMALLGPLAVIANLASSWRGERRLRNRVVSSIFVRYRVVAAADTNPFGGATGEEPTGAPIDQRTAPVSS